MPGRPGARRRALPGGSPAHPARLRPARAGRQTRHLLHRRRDVGRNGDRGQPLPLREGRRTGLAQAPGQGLRRDLGRQRLQRQRPAGRPAGVLALVIHAEPRLRRPQGRTEAPGGARRRRIAFPGARPRIRPRRRRPWPPGSRPIRATSPGSRAILRRARLLTIAEEFRARAGAGIGVISTVPFDHATPAAFVSHNTSRSAYYTGLKGYKGLGIADEIILRTKPDVVIAGGSPLLDNPGFDTKKGLHLRIPLPHAPGVERIRLRRAEARPGRRPGPRRGRRARPPARAASSSGSSAARAAISRCLGSRIPPAGPSSRRGAKKIRRWPKRPRPPSPISPAIPTGFFLVLEQGDIDWANHDNDFRSMIGCVADLDAAVRAALAFVDRPGDGVDWTNTVLLVTADHATGGLFLEPGRALGLGDLPRQNARVEDKEAAPPTGSDRGPETNGAVIKRAGVCLALRLSGRGSLLRHGGPYERARRSRRHGRGDPELSEAPRHLVSRSHPRQHPDQRRPARSAGPRRARASGPAGRLNPTGSPSAGCCGTRRESRAPGTRCGRSPA